MAVVTRPTLDGGWIQRDDATATSFPDMEGGWSQQEAAAAGGPVISSIDPAPPLTVGQTGVRVLGTSFGPGSLAFSSGFRSRGFK